MDRPVAIIVLAQLFGTSLWFSTNSVGTEMVRNWAVDPSAVGYLTASVQAGFIVGTLAISFTGIADRFPASRIFAVSAICGAAANACLALSPGLDVALALRLATGIALAGIYPLGNEIDHWLGA